MLTAGLFLAGCRGLPAGGESEARRQAEAVRSVYRPRDQRPDPSTLGTNSTLEDFLHFAMLNQPQVSAAYFDWLGSIERITVERSLPDPQLTFQSDIASLVTSVMPGLMQEFPGPGKLQARANAATAESQARYFAFETAVLQTAFDLKKSFYTLHFLDDRLRIDRETLSLLDDLERIARAQNEVGKATLQDVLRAQIERDRVRTAISNLDDSRRPLMAAFKAALGLAPAQADPPVPPEPDSAGAGPDSDELLAHCVRAQSEAQGAGGGGAMPPRPASPWPTRKRFPTSASG